MAFPQGTPQGISYQAVAYDSEGFEISNQDISVRLGILLGGVDAEASYTEVHSVTTDDFGLFSLVISEGETSDTFSSINWEEGAYLKVEVDEDLDGGYSVMGVSSFNAVPYALSAPTSDDILSRLNEIESLVDSIYEYGCMDSLACNYDVNHIYNDYLCAYPERGYDCFGNISEPYVGMEAYGGIIFYIDGSGQHGLVSAFSDLNNSDYQWGCDNTDLPGNDYMINGSNYMNTYSSGLQNTTEILDNCNGNTSASYATNYSYNNYSDWYLPSIYELDLMCNSIGPGSSLGNLGEFSEGGTEGDKYWSSNWATSGVAYYYRFNGCTYGNGHKTGHHNIRPIRSF